MAKQLRNKIADINKHKLVEAQLIDTVGDLCAIKIGGKRGNGGVLKGIPFIGPPGLPGQTVYVDYSSGKPIVQIFGQAAEQVSERRTIRSRPAHSEPPSEGGSSTTLPVADHTHDAILLTGVSDAIWYEPSDTGFLAAIAAAVDGDSIYLPDGWFNGPATIPHGVNLIGASNTTLQYKFITGGDNIFRNIYFWNTIVPNDYNVEIPDADDNVFFYDCKFYVAMGTADNYNVKLGHGGTVRAEFWNCHFEVSASDYNARAFYSTVAHGSPAQPWTKLFYCYFNISYTTGSHTAELWNSNCKLGTYGCSWLDGLDPGANVFWIDGDRTATSASDPTAIHTDGSNEIGGLTEKASPVNEDLLILEDSEAGYIKKKSQIGSLVPSIDTSNFDRNLSELDDTIQKALDTLDDIWMGGGSFSNVVWAFDGALAAQANAGFAAVIPRNCVIEKVVLYAKDPGDAGNTVIDINKNGVSIFSSNPSLSYGDPDNLVVAVPDTTSITENDVLTIDIDSVATGSSDAVVTVCFSVDMGTGDIYAIHDNQSGEIAALTEKFIPVNDDLLIIEDSEDDDAKKKVKVSSLPFSPNTIKGEKLFTREGEVTATGGTIRIANHSGGTRVITGVYLDIDTAPVGSALKVDIHKDGTTVFTTQANRPQIADGAYSGNSTTLDITSWPDGSYLTCDVDQIGATLAGSNLTVTVAYLE